MMKNRTVLFTLISLLCFSTLLIIFISFKKKGQSPVISIKLGSQEVALNDPKNVFFNVYPDLIIPSEGCALKGDIKLLDTTLKETELSEVVKKPTLILRFSATDCDICINAITSLINTDYKQHLNRLILITDGYSEKNFILKARYLGANTKIFNLPGEKENSLLGLPIEKERYTFLFCFK